MEKVVLPSYPSHVQQRQAGGPPVLHVKVLHGLSSDENTYGSPTGTVVPLSSAGVHNSGRPSVVCPAVAPATLRPSDDAMPGSSAANGVGAAPSSTLAKPVLDLAQVRCIPTDQWIPDAHVVNCMAPDCSNNFSLFNRKHRCRMCGRVFCSSCCNNIVYISTAVLNHAGNRSTEVVATGSHVSTNTSAYSTSYTSESPRLHRAVTSDCSDMSNGVGWRVSPPVVQSADSLKRTRAVSVSGSPKPLREGNGSLLPNGVAPTSAMTVTSSSAPSTQTSVACRVCAGCSYEVQLVVSTRQENGKPRRRSRGELKMLQRVLLVNVMSFLTLRDLASVSLVSADFYFMSRDNIIWYQYNMTRWMKESELPRFDSLKSQVQPHRGAGRYSTSGTVARSASFAEGIFGGRSAVSDATALSMSEASKRVISLHARYSYTQFLDFVRRQEMARCEGLSSFSLGARILLSSPIRLAIVGPCGIGKTASTRAFLGEKLSQMVVRPTIGFERRVVRVRLTGSLSNEVMLHIYDLSGADRYEKLRRFVCRHCHVIGLCYDPSRKVTLVQAADIMMGLEGALSAQPVVVCGLVRHQKKIPTPGSVPPSNRKASAGRLPESSTAAAAEVPLSGAPQRSGQSSSLPPPRAVLKETNRAPETSIDLASATSTRIGGASESDECDGGSSLRVNDGSLDASLPSRKMSTSAMSGSILPVFGAASTHNGGLEVSVDDAVGITVRGHSSIQCPLLQPTPFFEAAVQSVFDRLVGATVASTSTISEISEELMMGGNGANSDSTLRLSKSSSAGSLPASAMRTSSTHRRSRASRAIVQDLLNLTMQPCALDILLDSK